MRILTLIVSLIAALSLTATPATAKTFRWSFASDIPSMDIHSQNNALANMVHGAILLWAGRGVT
jgi:peptide/nickel transport system substrate-binding protein